MELTGFVAPVHNKNPVESLKVESSTTAQYSAAALTMCWFPPLIGMIDLHGKQCIQSMSLPIARFMMVQIRVEVKQNTHTTTLNSKSGNTERQTVVWSLIYISTNIKPLERSVIISPATHPFSCWLLGRRILHLFAFKFQASGSLLVQKYGIIKSRYCGSWHLSKKEMWLMKTHLKYGAVL